MHPGALAGSLYERHEPRTRVDLGKAIDSHAFRFDAKDGSLCRADEEDWDAPDNPYLERMARVRH